MRIWGKNMAAKNSLRENNLKENNLKENSLRSKKRILRAQILQRREALTTQERERAALLLAERILGHQWYYLSHTVLGFAAYGSEIDADEILREALRQGKTLYLPRVEGEEMHFYRVGTLEELCPGYKGIREPAADAQRYVYDEAQAAGTLMLMPGTAFDRERNRMGYGKGFYDRFLADKSKLQLRTVGVGFACQLLEEIPYGEEDIRPYQVICV